MLEYHRPEGGREDKDRMNDEESSASCSSSSAMVVGDKQWRRKAKKLRKRARNGEILTVEQTLECEKYGVLVKAEVEWAASLLEGKRSQLHVSEVRDAVLHIVGGGKAHHKPSWLNLTNAGLVNKVVVVGISGVESGYLQENLTQLPFLHSCGRALPITFYKSKGVRRAIYPLLFYRLGRDGRRRGDDDDEEEEAEKEDDDDEDEDEEQKKDKRAEEGTNGAGPSAGEVEEESEEDDGTSSDVTVSVDPVERFVMGPEQLRLHGYPVPPNKAPQTQPSAVGEGEDLGEPLDLQPDKLSDTPPAWLTCDEKGVWGETGSLVPTLEEARAILSTLPGLRVGGKGDVGAGQEGSGGTIFYETLGGRDPLEQPPYKMVALDCEMCQTGEGNELTRLTLVDEQRVVLLDAFVKPYRPIVDYHTKYSGITPEIMAGCSTRIEQVQVALLRLIRADTVLVGHSLEQDLTVVRLMHLRCIDTSVLYPHPRGGQCRYALRVLAKKYLRRVIQNSKLGHCSEEDAVAALDLVHLKVARGPDFGVEGVNAAEDTRGLPSILELMHEAGKRSVLVDQAETLGKCVRGQTAALVAASNEEALAKAKAQASQAVPPHFLWASLSGGRPPSIDTIAIRKQREREAQQAKRQKVQGGSSPSSISSANRHVKFTYEEDAIMEMVDRELLRADQALAEIFESLSPSTLLVVLTQPDVTLASQLMVQRQASMDVRATLPWTQENEAMLHELCKKAQQGLIMMRVR